MVLVIGALEMTKRSSSAVIESFEDLRVLLSAAQSSLQMEEIFRFKFLRGGGERSMGLLGPRFCGVVKAVVVMTMISFLV